MSKTVEDTIVKCPKCEYQFTLSKALKESIEVQVGRRIELEYVEREAELEERVMRRADEQHRLTDAAKDKQPADSSRKRSAKHNRAHNSSRVKLRSLIWRCSYARPSHLINSKRSRLVSGVPTFCKELWISPEEPAAL